jgi:hypothetical protein
VHLLGVAPNSHIKSSTELLQESFLATLLNLGQNPECTFDPVRQWSTSSLAFKFLLNISSNLQLLLQLRFEWAFALEFEPSCPQIMTCFKKSVRIHRIEHL